MGSGRSTTERWDRMLPHNWVLTYKAGGNIPGAHARAFLDAGTGVELWGDSTS
jgi:hypothetical protein